MADVEVIVIDDSCSDEEDTSSSAAAAVTTGTTTAAAATAAADTNGPAAKRARLDGQGTAAASPSASPSASPGSGDDGAIVTPSLTGACAAAAVASSSTSNAAAGGAAAAGSKKRPSPTLGDEAKKLDPSLAKQADATTNPNRVDDEEPIVVTEPRKMIVDIMSQSNTPPSFCTGSPRSVGFPGLVVNGEGHIAFPLLPPQATSLASRGTQHPVRGAPLFQWLPEEFSFQNPTFSTSMDKLMKDACGVLRIDQDKVSCVLYKMLLHGTGGAALNLRNARIPGVVASIVVLPPCLYTGGKITVKRAGSPIRTVTFDFCSANAYDCAYFCLFDCSCYDIEPLQSGSRLMFIYNVVMKPATTVPRIRFRDEARIRREFRAATEQWGDTTNNGTNDDDKPLVWMTENQYQAKHNGKAPANSCFRGNDRKVAELLQQTIREGSNVDWCVGTVEYVVEGKGKNNPDYSASEDYVFDQKQREELNVNLGQLGKLKLSSHVPVYLCPGEYYDKVTPKTTFERSYSYYSDEIRIKAKKTYASRSCLYVWPRSLTWKCVGRNQNSVGTIEMVGRMIKYLDDGTKSRFAGPAHMANSKKLMDDMMGSLSSYSCGAKLAELAALVTRFDAADAAKRLIGMLEHSSDIFRKSFYESALPNLLRNFGAPALLDKVKTAVETMHTTRLAEFVLAVLETKCGENPDSKVHPFREVLVSLSKCIYEQANSRNNIRCIGEALGGSDSEYGCYHSSTYWPKHGVSKILVLMCDNFDVQEEGSSEGSPPTVFSDFIGGIVPALAWNKSETTMDRIANNFCTADLERVGRTMAGNDAWCCLMAQCFVEKTPLEVAADLTLRVIKETKNGTQNGNAPKSAVNLFAWPLVKGAAQSVSSHFALALMKRLNEEGSKGQHRAMAKSLRSIPDFEVDLLISFLCESTKPPSNSEAANDSAVAGLSEHIAKLFCTLGTAFVDQSNAQDRDIFGRILSKASLTSVFTRCGQAVLGNRIREWVDKLDLGVGAGIVLNFCDLEEGSGQSEAANATTDAAELSMLSREFLHSFAKRVIGDASEGHCKTVSTSLSAQKNRSYLDEATPIWPANSIGIIMKNLCAHEKNSTVTNDSSGGGEIPSVAKFLSVTFQAIALDRSSTVVKSESSSGTCKRLLSVPDVAIVFQYIGLPALLKILEDLVAALPFAAAADFIVAGQSGRTKSSTAALAFVTADALKAIATDNEGEEVAMKLMLSFLRQRIVGNGTNAHFAQLASSLAQHPSLTRDILGHLCKDQSSALRNGRTPAVKREHVIGFVSAICNAVTQGPPFRFHENSLLQEDFDAAVTICGYEALSSGVNPAISFLITVGRISEAVYLLNLMLNNATKEAHLKGCALHLAVMVLKTLNLYTSQSSLENKALCIIMFWVSHFEGTAAALWTASLMAACAPAPPGPFSAPLAASTRLVETVFKFKLEDMSKFLAEADTLLSSSSAELKTIASVRVAALFEQIACRAVATAEGKVSAAPRRPTSTWKLVDGDGYLGYYLSKYWGFLSNPCLITHTQRCKQTDHTRTRNAFRPMMQRREVEVTFFQYNGRGLYYIKVTKLKKLPLASSSAVPKCKCHDATCELNVYHRAATGTASVNVGFVDGLKDSKNVFAMRAKGQKPEPEVEVVPPPPKPQAEVVDLIE